MNSRSGPRAWAVRSLAFALVLAPGPAAFGADIAVDATLSGASPREISAAAGDTISIELETRAGTGFEWAASQVPGILQFDGSTQRSAARSDAMVGGVKRQILTFRVVRTGEETLVLGYRRPWKKAEEHAQTLKFKVVVK